MTIWTILQTTVLFICSAIQLDNFYTLNEWNAGANISRESSYTFKNSFKLQCSTWPYKRCHYLSREKKKTRPSAKSNSLKSTLSEMCYFKRFCLELKKQQEAISKNSKKSHMFYITVFLEEFFVRKVALLRTIILNQIFQNKICTNSRPIFPSYRNQ